MRDIQRTKKQKHSSSKFGAGFTLIEILIVISIIGMLAAIVLALLGTSRAKSRDAKRIEDLTQIRNGLELYFTEGQGYPDANVWNSDYLSGAPLACNGNNYFNIPSDPLGQAYTYKAIGSTSAGCGGTVYANFEIDFSTEQPSSLGAAGNYILTSTGFSPAP